MSTSQTQGSAGIYTSGESLYNAITNVIADCEDPRLNQYFLVTDRGREMQGPPTSAGAPSRKTVLTRHLDSDRFHVQLTKRGTTQTFIVQWSVDLEFGLMTQATGQFLRRSFEVFCPERLVGSLAELIEAGQGTLDQFESAVFKGSSNPLVLEQPVALSVEEAKKADAVTPKLRLLVSVKDS